MKTLLRLLALALAPLALHAAANLTGTWKAEFDTQIGRQKYTFTFKQDGSQLTGKTVDEIDGEKSQGTISEGKVEGDKVSFVENLSYQGNDLRLTYTGTISGDELKLARNVMDIATEQLVAKRAPADEASGAKPAEKAKDSKPKQP